MPSMSVEPSSRTEIVRVGLLLCALISLAIGATIFAQSYTQRTEQKDAAEATLGTDLPAKLEIRSAELAQLDLELKDASDRILARVTSSTVPEVNNFAAMVANQQLEDVSPGILGVVYQNQIAMTVAVTSEGEDATELFATLYDPLVIVDRTRDGAPFLIATDETWLLTFPSGDRHWLTLVIDPNMLLAENDNGTVQLIAEPPPSGEQTIFNFEGDSGSITDQEQLAATPITLTVSDVVEDPAASWLQLALRVAPLLAIAPVLLLLRARIPRYVRPARGRRSQRRKTDHEHATAPAVGFEQTIVGVAELDATGLIVAANGTFAEQAGRSTDGLPGASVISLTHSADRSRLLGELDPLLTGGKRTGQVEFRFERIDETEIWVLAHLSRSTRPDGTDRILVQTQDITVRRNAIWNLARQALHDELTELPNRAMLLHRLHSALELSKAQQTLIGVMFIDIDRFKIVNDSLGHDAGDDLIKHVAQRMSQAVRSHDTVSRFGGDEFVVLCDGLSGTSEVVAVAERIRRAVANPFVAEGATIHQTLSIGISLCHSGSQDADDLLRDADAAMYRAKERGRNRIEIFDQGMRDILLEKMTLESELRQAISNEELEMFFQSIVRSSDFTTAGFEALVRWQHPTRGLLTPGQFLPVAEEAGLQGQMDRLGLRQTCQVMADWASRFPQASSYYVSSNTVPNHFLQFVDHIQEVLAETGLNPDRLLVEVVENALIDDADGALESIEAIKQLGARVAIDDFGTGYSSLSYLTQFAPDVLKIDRAFVCKLPDDKATAAVVRAIAAMADALGISVIAEGIETWEQAEALREMGVPYFQGFLFAKPRSQREIEEWLMSAQTHGVEPPLAFPGQQPQPTEQRQLPPPPATLEEAVGHAAPDLSPVQPT